MNVFDLAALKGTRILPRRLKKRSVFDLASFKGTCIFQWQFKKTFTREIGEVAYIHVFNRRGQIHLPL